jgi:hypothetical protein
MIDGDGFRRQAREIAACRLLKARGLLAAVSGEERCVIEQVAYAVAAGVAECLLEEAARNEAVAAALGSPPSGPTRLRRGADRQGLWDAAAGRG